MKRYLLPLLLLLPTLAAAQVNPFSCADVEILEPGWVCYEHFGYNYPDWEGIAGNLGIVGVDAKGSLYRGWRENVPEGEFCGSTPRRQTILKRYSDGWGLPGGEADRADIYRIRDKCVSSQITANAITSRVQPLPGGEILLFITVNNFNHWVIRLEREPVAIEPASELAVSVPEGVLAVGPASGEGEAGGVRVHRVLNEQPHGR